MPSSELRTITNPPITSARPATFIGLFSQKKLSIARPKPAHLDGLLVPRLGSGCAMGGPVPGPDWPAPASRGFPAAFAAFGFSATTTFGSSPNQ